MIRETRKILLEMRSLNTRRSRISSLGLVLACWMICFLFGMPAYPWLILLPLLTVSILTDVAWTFIPNWLTASSAVSLIALSFLAGPSTTSEAALSGLTITFAVSIVLYATMGLGAGDVKLAACIGACLGPGPAMTMLFSTYIVAGTAALLTLMLRRAHPLCHCMLNTVGLGALAPQLSAFSISDYIPRKQPMAPWFAVGTLLTIFGAANS